MSATLTDSPTTSGEPARYDDCRLLSATPVQRRWRTHDRRDRINITVAGALIAAPALAARSGAVVLGQLVALAGLLGLSAGAFVLWRLWHRATPPKFR